MGLPFCSWCEWAALPATNSEQGSPQSLNSFLKKPFSLCRRPGTLFWWRMSKDTSLPKPKFNFVAIQHSLRCCNFVAINGITARNITALLSGVRLSLQSWWLEKSPFLSKAQTEKYCFHLCYFSEKKLYYKSPALNGENWGKFSASCEISQADTSLGCGTVSPSSAFVQWDSPVYKFGHLLVPWQMEELRTNRESNIRSQYKFLLLCGYLISNTTEGVLVEVCKRVGLPHGTRSCSALAEMWCHKFFEF